MDYSVAIVHLCAMTRDETGIRSACLGLVWSLRICVGVWYCITCSGCKFLVVSVWTQRECVSISPIAQLSVVSKPFANVAHRAFMSMNCFL